jgi:RNA polymerase sigma factor (TIGR02999 family)
MAMPLRDLVTSTLAAGGEPDADESEALVNRLVPFVYQELRGMAHALLARERDAHTLGTTALVHEAYLKLVDESRVVQRGRAYFFAAAARAMRQVLIDYARRRGRVKRGGGRTAISLDSGVIAVDALAGELVDLDEALERLAATYPRLARVVECRFFGGLSVEETAAALGLSPRSVKRDWALARAWLYRDLRGAGGA